MNNSVYSNNIIQFEDSVLEENLTNHALAKSIEKETGRNSENFHGMMKVQGLTDT